MNTVAFVAVLVGAVAYLAAAPIELFFIDRPWARAFLHVQVDNVADVRMWAFVVGFRNMLAGIGAIVGLVMVFGGDETAGRAVVLTVTWYMLAASFAMGIADLHGFWRPRGGSVLGTVGSSVPPLVALLAI